MTEAANEPIASSMDYPTIYVIGCYGNRAYSRRHKMTADHVSSIPTQFDCDVR